MQLTAPPTRSPRQQFWQSCSPFILYRHFWGLAHSSVLTDPSPSQTQALTWGELKPGRNESKTPNLFKQESELLPATLSQGGSCPKPDTRCPGLKTDCLPSLCLMHTVFRQHLRVRLPHKDLSVKLKKEKNNSKNIHENLNNCVSQLLFS